MIGSGKLMKMAPKKWMKVAGIVRKWISFQGATEGTGCSTTERASATKGHFAVYTNDGKRFMVPLKWLSSEIFIEVLKKAEEEFGLCGNGPIVLPFDASFMEGIMKYLNGLRSKELGEALLLYMGGGNQSSSSSVSINNQQQLLVC